MVRHEMELRNIRHAVVMRYLGEAGATRVGDMDAEGEGWKATLSVLEPVQLKTMVIPRSLLVIEGQEDALVQPVYDYMRRGMMRGGG